MIRILTGMLILLSVVGYFYYSSTEEKLAKLNKELSVYGIKFEQQQEAIDELVKKQSTQTSALKQIQIKNQEIETEIAKSLEIFKEHNLTKLSVAKPGLIEQRANKATKEIFNEIEAISASINAFNDGVQPVSPSSSGNTNSN